MVAARWSFRKLPANKISPNEALVFGVVQCAVAELYLLFLVNGLTAALGAKRDDTGIVLQPTSVENKGSGHHREVILTFPRPSLKRTWLELVIKDIAGEKERIFRWYR